MKDQVVRFKWFWVWQDNTEERWLEEMSRQGYHLTSVSLPCIYTFIKSESANYSYRLDYRRFSNKEKQHYLQIFIDAGWEYLGEMSLWQYFRKQEKTGEVNEIFTDNESKIAKYHRILAYLGFFWIVLLAILIGRITSTPVLPWWGNVHVFILVVLTLMTYAIGKIWLRIRQLRT
ncbi:MAG: DUF2812 domain-containing protein [Dehalococcoidales bacterium]|nr:MAG: DUF2812 domain-containing protein [Dehalococcoidales bacterium]